MQSEERVKQGGKEMRREERKKEAERRPVLQNR
jgi:hypothetical protein